VDRWFGMRLQGLHHRVYFPVFVCALALLLMAGARRIAQSALPAALAWGGLAGYSASLISYALLPVLLVALGQKPVAFFFEGVEAGKALLLFPVFSLSWCIGALAGGILVGLSAHPNRPSAHHDAD
jgi:hypothetical protein